MCLLLTIKKPLPGISFALAHNRDEFISRDFTPIEHHQNLWFGQDLAAKGTWMAFAPNGNWSAVLNIRVSPKLPKAERSRGELPIDALQEKDIFSRLPVISNKYNPFTLIKGNSTGISEAYSSTNHKLESNFNVSSFSISNNPLGASWEKPNLALKRLESISPKNEDDLFASLLNILEDKNPIIDKPLPVTEYPKEIEFKLSPNFVQIETYQTVLSTIALFNENGRIQIFEKNHVKKTETRHEIFN